MIKSIIVYVILSGAAFYSLPTRSRFNPWLEITTCLMVGWVALPIALWNRAWGRGYF